MPNTRRDWRVSLQPHIRLSYVAERVKAQLTLRSLAGKYFPVTIRGSEMGYDEKEIIHEIASLRDNYLDRLSPSDWSGMASCPVETLLVAGKVIARLEARIKELEA